MSVRIRVYPQNGLGGYGGYGGYGMNRIGGYGYGLANVRLQNEKRTSALRLNYERALWQERIKTVQLQSALQYGGNGIGAPRIVTPFGGAMLGAGMLGGGLFGGAGLGMGSILPQVLAGNGQTNITNQTGAGAAQQTVTNANNYSNPVANRPGWGGYGGYGGYPTPWGGGGGFFSSLLGSLI